MNAESTSGDGSPSATTTHPDPSSPVQHAAALEETDFPSHHPPPHPSSTPPEQVIAGELNGQTFTRGQSSEKLQEDSGRVNGGSRPQLAGARRQSSIDGSVSATDDSPSIDTSLLSSPGRRHRLRSPNPSLRPFDRRFKSRLSPSPLVSPRQSSPGLLTARSRQSSVFSNLLPDTASLDESASRPWEVMRWAKLKKLSGLVFSETGKRNHGRPTCIAVSSHIAIGTSKGIILVFDYHQDLRAVIGVGTKAVENGEITAVALSADHSTVAGGHASGSIFTWEIAKPAKPFLSIAPMTMNEVGASGSDSHVVGSAILHLGFLGTRHTALVSADERGMAFSHLATRGMGAIARVVRTTRILGRYPEISPRPARSRKASSVLAFSPLPLGNTETAADSLGLIAMLTPYLLVIVSTTPVAQTQHKASRPKDLAAHGALSGALAWYPPMRQGKAGRETQGHAKLAYCWLDVVMVLDVTEVEPSDEGSRDGPPELHFRLRTKWKGEESIVAIQWLSQSVLAVLTITQQLLILEDGPLSVTDSSDLTRKHTFHADLFSQQLSQLVETMDEENESMHGVVADAFYMSFKAYKARLFLLGYEDISIGNLSNWADRLLALMENGDFIGAIVLATNYYTGDAHRATVGLPDDDEDRHDIVQEKLLEMISASLKYAFGKNENAGTAKVSESELEQLCEASFRASLSVGHMDILFDEVYDWYVDGKCQRIFFNNLELCISSGDITTIPPTILKDFVNYFVSLNQNSRLEEVMCRLDPSTLDLDQATALCKKNRLYDALFYIWTRAIGDYTTILKGLVDLPQSDNTLANVDPQDRASASRIFPFLSYTLTGRVYPTGEPMPAKTALEAKAEIYHLLFSGNDGSAEDQNSFRYLRGILDLDSSSFMSMLNEAFEDSFLNDSADAGSDDREFAALSDEQRFGLSLNRQYIITILLEILSPPDYGPGDIIYLDMFIARSLPKFPQFILLPGSTLHKVLFDLCDYPTEDVADDCQLSVEYLLSVYQPPDLPSLISALTDARFYRVIKSIYKTERQYALLMEVCFQDAENPVDIFDCITECLNKKSGLSNRQVSDVQQVIAKNARALAMADVQRAAVVLEEHAPNLHETVVEALQSDEHAQYRYLNSLLEPEQGDGVVRTSAGEKSPFVELYVRLLCDYDRAHVAEYIDRLQSGNLRLSEVLPSLEESGVIDAAVILMAREGHAARAIERLLQHLRTIETALLSLLEGAKETPDLENTKEALNDFSESLEKYVRVGIWLCQGQTAASNRSKSKSSRENESRAERRKSAMYEKLKQHETFWLDLTEAVVRITSSASSAIEGDRPADADEAVPATPSRQEVPRSGPYASSRIVQRLRIVVQETFTALLAATSVPSSSPPDETSRLSHSLNNSNNNNNNNASASGGFLRILRAFLSRASEWSPSLSHLRAVLAAIFAAYTYEEGLLALANRLLDKDLFVHVEEVVAGRKRGWRPLGQVCGGCGVRVWGPGAGAAIWEAWLHEHEHGDGKNERAGDENTTGSRTQTASADAKGKGKAVAEPTTTVGIEASGTSQSADPAPDAIVIFSCRHLFHRKCLEGMAADVGKAGTRAAGGGGGSSNGGYGERIRTSDEEEEIALKGFKCPLEVDVGTDE